MGVQALEDRMQEEQIDVAAARQAVKDYINETSATQSELAKNTGLSPAAISTWLRDEYKGNNEMIARALMQVLEVDVRRRQAIQEPEFVITSIAQEILMVVKHAHDYEDIGVVYGPAGRGKSLTLEYYANQYPGTIYIEANTCISTPKAMLEELVDALGKSETGNKRKLWRAIVSSLKGSGRLLIIDEAQQLTPACLETIRGIYDACDIGLLLAGNEDVYIRMRGRDKAPFAQLFSRVGIKLHLTDEVDKDDVRKIIEQEAQVSEECLDFFHQVANSPWGLRQAVKLFVLSYNLAGKMGRDLDVDTITQVSDWIMR